MKRNVRCLTRTPHASRHTIQARQRTRCRHRLLQAERLEDRQLLATISGAVFNDLNADGVKNTGESGQSGWTVYLDADGNGQLGTGETSTITAANGSYSFSGLAAGTYTVAEVQQLGWQQTSPIGTVPTIERVSVAADGAQGNGSSGRASLSADGRFATFYSSANNLVPGDTNGQSDIFVHDRQTGTIERVSVATDGTQGNDDSRGYSISADGRYVGFMSLASNLVPGDTNGAYDIFVYDRQAHTLECVSLTADDTTGNGSSWQGKISADGRFVAFGSDASNLVPDDTNGVRDAFVYDRQTKEMKRVSVAADGTQGNGGSSTASTVTISADGRYVALDSYATNLVPGDTNGYEDAFVYDRQTGTIERVSVAADGTQGNRTSRCTSLSDDGRYVTFQSFADNLVPGDTNGYQDVFVLDRETNTVERVNVSNDGTQGNMGANSPPRISADGRFVTFQSNSSNLVPGDTNGDTDAFVFDRQTDMIQLVSVASDGTQGNASSGTPSISADGRFVGFQSYATNLVPGDTNGTYGLDAFVTVNPFTWVPGSHTVEMTSGQDVSGIDFGNASPTKFYVVNDAVQNLTYEYNASRQLNESYSLNTGNTAPRGAASTIAGDKTWVVDANRKVYVYNHSGALLGSWTAGTLASNATVEGITTNGTDVWIVDAKSDKVYKYTGAATRLSGSQNAASSFSLNSGNTNPKDIVTDGTYLWVVNDSTTDKVFLYSNAGTWYGSWTITTPGVTSPTGITVDPAVTGWMYANIWIVDAGTDRVYQYNAAGSIMSFVNGSSHAADLSFALAAGNTNPQGIADPPAPGSLLTTETPVLAEPVSAEAALVGNDVALEGMYYEPLKKIRIDTVRRSESRIVESHARDLSYTVGASANRLADNSRWASDHHRDTEVDDLFAEWDSDPLELLSLSDLGM